jgi:hypothetical protein
MTIFPRVEAPRSLRVSAGMLAASHPNGVASTAYVGVNVTAFVPSVDVGRQAMADAGKNVDWDEVKAFAGLMTNDIGAAMQGALTYIGDRLGIF